MMTFFRQHAGFAGLILLALWRSLGRLKRISLSGIMSGIMPGIMPGRGAAPLPAPVFERAQPYWAEHTYKAPQPGPMATQPLPYEGRLRPAAR